MVEEGQIRPQENILTPTLYIYYIAFSNVYGFVFLARLGFSMCFHWWVC